jgi:hypothetical protein
VFSLGSAHSGCSSWGGIAFTGEVAGVEKRSAGVVTGVEQRSVGVVTGVEQRSVVAPAPALLECLVTGVSGVPTPAPTCRDVEWDVRPVGRVPASAVVMSGVTGVQKPAPACCLTPDCPGSWFMSGVTGAANFAYLVVP